MLVEAQLARDDPRHIEQVVDEPLLQGDGALDHGARMFYPRNRRAGAPQYLGLHQDGGEGRPQLVGEGREEQILRAVGRLGDRARCPFLLEPPLLGEVLERQQRGLLPARPRHAPRRDGECPLFLCRIAELDVERARRGLTGQDVLDGAAHGLAVPGVAGEREQVVPDVHGSVPEHPFECWIGRHHPAALVDDQQRHLDALDDGPGVIAGRLRVLHRMLQGVDVDERQDGTVEPVVRGGIGADVHAEPTAGGIAHLPLAWLARLHHVGDPPVHVRYVYVELDVVDGAARVRRDEVDERSSVRRESPHLAL